MSKRLIVVCACVLVAIGTTGSASAVHLMGSAGQSGAVHTIGSPSQAMARTWVVDDNGADCRNANFTMIQPAVTAAGPGDKIQVCRGNYPEQVAIGPGKDGLKLESKGHWDAVIQAPAIMLVNKAIVDVTGSQDVKITGFTITGPGPGGCDSIRYGVRIDGGGQANVEKNHITLIRDVPFSGCQNGIAVNAGRVADSTVGSVTLKDNVIDNYQKGGVVVSNTGSSGIVEHNDVTGAGPTDVIAQNGIQFSGGAVGRIKDNNVSGNVYSPASVTSTGILLFSSGAVEVEHNTLTSNDSGVFAFAQTEPVSIEHNEASMSSFDGIDLVDVTGATVEHNRSFDNTFDGIFLGVSSGPTSGNEISHNKVLSNGEDGIWLLDADDNTVSDNRADGNANDGIHAGLGSTGNSFDKNHMTGNTVFDADDESWPSNIWTNNRCDMDNPAGELCR